MKNPCLFIGVGTTDFHVNEGNVHINEHIDFKEPLRLYELKELNDGDLVVTFFGSNDAEVYNYYYILVYSIHI